MISAVPHNFGPPVRPVARTSEKHAQSVRSASTEIRAAALQEAILSDHIQIHNERLVMKKILAAVFAMFFASAVMAQAAPEASKPAAAAKPAAHKVVKHHKKIEHKKRVEKKMEKKVEKKTEAAPAAK